MSSYLLQGDDGFARADGGLGVRQDCADGCCDTVPPGLLAAVLCSECCARYDQALPVDPDAAPGWQERPVFYLHGRCWRIVGPWEGDDPPPWLIVRGLFDFLRWADCPSCFLDNLDCPILAPACSSLSPMPNEYALRVNSIGQGVRNNVTWRWNLTTEQRITDVRIPCRTGCYTGPQVRAGAVASLGNSGETFHGLLGATDATFRSRFFGAVEAVQNGNVTARFVASTATRSGIAWGAEIDVYHRSQPLTSFAYMAWDGVFEGFGNQRVVELAVRLSSASNGAWFWARGERAGGSALFRVLGTDGFEITNAQASLTRWSLRPISTCCQDAPPPDGGPGDTDAGGGVGPLGEGNQRAIREHQAAGIEGGCAGCGG